MLKMVDVFFLLCLAGAANGLYKQWIPDTNYENKTNWDKGVVPCGGDKVVFPAQGKVSVYVETLHSVQEMKLPVNGEFFLDSGAGFYVGGGQEPGCGAGVTNQFKDSESLRWFDPGLWQAAETLDDLEQGHFLFSVHEEGVPCQHDHVIFKARSSFRVDTTSDRRTIPVQSVSVLGKRYNSKSEFSQYLGSRSGQLQFHGSSVVTVGKAGCEDISGCDCGNSANRDQICKNVKCSSLTCKRPLRPVGHCCDVCGALVTIRYTTGFNLQTYRQRLRHLFLVQPVYSSVQLGISKVFKSQRIMGIVPFGASPEIQIVILDGETGPQSGTVAEKLTRELVKDALSQGSSQGIAEVEFQASSGSSSDDRPGVDVAVVVGAVLGVLIIGGLISFVGVLARKGIVQMPKISMPLMPSMPSFSRFRDDHGNGDLGGPLDHGFENPIFDKPVILPTMPSLYGTDVNDSITMTQSGVHYVNPVYNEHETDI